MRRAPLLLGVLLLCAGCASAPRPGPTEDGIAVAVPARDKSGARRQAVESLLPLFLTPEGRREKSAAIDKAVFAAPKDMKAFVGDQKLSKTGAGLVEVKIDALSAALQGAGLIRPPGYGSGPEVLLLALGDRAAGANAVDRLAAGSLETALFGRGIQAQDADDDIIKLKRPITAKTEDGVVAQAAAGGWTGLVAGRVSGEAHREVQSGSWRGRARYSLALYGVGRSTEPERFDADGEALNVSTISAVGDAIDAAAQTAALRVDGILARRHAGRATIGVLVSGYKDPVFLSRVIGDLRKTQGVEGAALVAWKGFDEMALIHAYATTLTADGLAAKLINADPALRVTAVETEDGRITVTGAEIPASEDAGQDQ